MDQYAASPGHSTYCYAKLAATLINFPLLLATFWCRERYQRQMQWQSLSVTLTIGGPTYLIPPFLCQIPFLLPASQFRLAWNRLQIMLDCLSSGLVYIRHSAECIMHHTTLKLGQCHYQWAAYTIAKIFTLCTISDFPNFTITFHTNHILECL